MSNEWRFVKVGVGKSHVMHIMDIESDLLRQEKTLCGLDWYAENGHGESYCQNCQRILRSLGKRGVYKREE